MLDFLPSPFELLFLIPTLIISISIHEAAHALAADRLGDPTPRVQGRLTLNPKAHLDLVGTLMLIFFRFGWGKPVQFDPYNLTNPRRDAAIISFAGPAANLALATALAIILRVSAPLNFLPHILDTVVAVLIQYNVILAVFNLIPVHPLDGGKILIGLLPPEIANDWDRILNQYGMIILIFLVFPIFGGTPIVWNILSPAIILIMSLLLPYSGLI